MQLPQKPTPRVFSGMQPTGNLHLGNYLGAMVRWVEMQRSHECIYCVVDMHAITMWQDPQELKGAIRHAGFEDGTFFPLPEPVIMGPATRVMSLRDGTKKMSKSEPSDMSRINMTDDADTIAKKIQRAKTDPHPLPTSETELAARPE